MEKQVQQLLQLSAKLFETLSTIPKGEERDAYIAAINDKLDERGAVITELKQLGFKPDSSNKIHALLAELDKGIRERLNNVLSEVKLDLKELQNSKKNEMQYVNPYASVQVMDGMYYDKKK